MSGRCAKTFWPSATAATSRARRSCSKGKRRGRSVGSASGRARSRRMRSWPSCGWARTEAEGPMRWFVTGGAGFIGANTVVRLLEQGHEVIIFDNLSRPGSEKNLAWLRERRSEFGFIQADIRDAGALRQALADHAPYDAVLHFAAQVAVTTSVTDPRLDFDINAPGTFNLLEAVRGLALDPVLLFTSTNKVYGALPQFSVF